MVIKGLVLTLSHNIKHLKTVLKDLEQESGTLLKWFTDDLLKGNPEKDRLFVSTDEDI